MVGSEVMQGEEIAVKKRRVTSSAPVLQRKRLDERAGIVVVSEFKERFGAGGESIGVGRLQNDRLRAVPNDELCTESKLSESAPELQSP